MCSVEKVTISDCANALNAIDEQIEKLTRDKTAIQRAIDALRTQGLLINQLVKRL